MERRALLAAAAAATTAGFAGCIANRPGDRSESTPTEGASPTDGSTPSPTDSGDGPRLADRSFEVVRVECGSDYGDYDVTTSDGVVTVEGVLDGSNGCYTAELVTAEYDAAADELYVEVEAVEDRDDDEVCTSCIVEVEYVAEFTFEDGEPSSVRVEQRGASSANDGESDGGADTPTPTPTGTGTDEYAY